MRKNKTRSFFVSLVLAMALLPLGTYANVFLEQAENNSDDIKEVVQQKKADLLEQKQEMKSASAESFGVAKKNLNLKKQDFQKYITGEIIVKYKNDNGKPFRVVKLPQGKTVDDAVLEYGKRGDVEYAEPNYIMYAFMTPNDTYYSYQWHMDNDEYGGIGMEEAWNTSTGENVVVAVIDTGIAYEKYTKYSWPWKRYYQAPDLANTCFVQGYDFVENDTHPNDDNQHGTHVAGTIAQSTNNNTGVAGVAYDACLMPIKVLDKNGSGSYSAITQAIRYAADNGAHVVNMSLGGSSPSQALQDALEYAYNKGVTLVAATGNDGSSTISYPAAYNDYVIAVGATRYDEALVSYSNYGADLDIVAPGGDTSVDQNGDGYSDGVLQNTFALNDMDNFGYYFFQGTSMATPHVAAVAALVISHGNATTPDDVRAALEQTADDLGAAGRDDTFGNGLVNASAALGWSAGPIDNPPTVNITNPADGATVVGVVTITADATDDNGVSQVDFYVGENLIGSDTTSTTNPYAIDWDSTGVSDGEKTITATAIDTASQTGSDSITVTVDNINDAPVADAGDDQSVSDSNGDGSETVTLNGSSSYDPDGTIVSYEWREGSTTIATSSIAAVSVNVGVRTYTLTVTDDDGATANDDVVVTVLANQAPSANAGDDQTVTLGTAVTFNGSSSNDPDGTIELYKWNFGNGNTATGATANHTYTATGTYAAILTVTDNGGLTDTDTVEITVTEEPSELEVFYDSFERSEWNGLWVEDNQNDWFRSSQRATDGTRSAEVDGRAQDASLTSINIDLQRKTSATVTFDWLIERTVDRNEYLAVDISTDNGATWQEYKRLKGNVDTENVWHQETIEIDGANNITLRFRGKMSRSNEDANVDNVRVVAK